LNELGYDENYFRKRKTYSELEKVPAVCPKCRHCWQVEEDVIEAECPKCRSIVPGPLTETRRSK
jgi:Zn finger protein HypA/HybF involved in hydrogenase expression